MVETKGLLARARTLSAPARLRVAVVAVALIVVLVAIGVRVSAPSGASTQALAGKSAPNFTLPVAAAPGATPKTISLAAQRGHPVALVFFFTLCTHCQSQLRAVHATAASYSERGLATFAINSPAESYDVLANYSSRLGFAPTILRDTQSAATSAYGVRLYPTTVLIDRQGVVRAVWAGEADPTTLDRAFSEAIGS